LENPGRNRKPPGFSIAVFCCMIGGVPAWREAGLVLRERTDIAGRFEMEYYGTLGPSCKDEKTLKEMFQAGMTGVRLNLSHGDLKENGHWISLAAKAAAEAGCLGGRRPQILMDLRGPEVRLGRLEADKRVNEGDTVVFGGDGIPVPEIAAEYVKAGDRLLIDDGKLSFSVWEVSGGRIVSKALCGGVLHSEKSLAVEGKEIPMPTLTESDYENIRHGAEYGVTGVMLPFVRGKEDLLTLKNALADVNAGQIGIFAKIENRQGVAAIEELLPYCDHLVIARGDLGNAMPLWKLPAVQKLLAKKCREAGKPFMVVTQMLDSMHTRPVPTRAEVLDIYNAVLDGAASLMLTGETAAGQYPVKAMEYLVRTGEEACRDMGL